MRCSPVCLTVLLVALATGGCHAATPTPTADAARFIKYCAVCHGEDGRSKPDLLSTPHLNSQPLLAVVDDAFLYENIARGRPGENGRGRAGTKMSAFADRYGGPLAEADVRRIVDYVRRWQSDPAVKLEPFTADGDAMTGATVFTSNCVACHGVGGWADSLAPSLAGDTLQRTASDAYFRHTARNGRPGTTMLAFTLSDEQANDLVTYIRTFGDRDAP